MRRRRAAGNLNAVIWIRSDGIGRPAYPTCGQRYCGRAGAVLFFLWGTAIWRVPGLCQGAKSMGDLERALLAAPPVEAPVPSVDVTFRRSHLSPTSPAHDSDQIQRAIDQGRRQQRIRSTHSRLNSLDGKQAAAAAAQEPASPAITLRRKAVPCALAVAGAALQLLCWVAAYGFDLHELEERELRERYVVGGSLWDLGALTLFQLGWLLGALCVCRVRSHGFRLAVGVLLLTSVAAFIKLVLLLAVPADDAAARSGSGDDRRRWRRPSWSIAMAMVSVIVPAAEVVFLRAFRNSHRRAAEPPRARAHGGGGFTRHGWGDADGPAFPPAEDPDYEPRFDGLPAAQSSGDEEEEAISTGEQQRWLRGASLRSGRDSKRSGSHSAGRTRTDADMSTESVEWGAPAGAQEVEGDDRTLEAAEARLEAKRRSRHAAREGDAPVVKGRSRSGSREHSSKSKTSSKEGRLKTESSRESAKDKLRRGDNGDRGGTGGPDIDGVAPLIGGNAADFLATPQRKFGSKSSKRAREGSSKPWTAATARSEDASAAAKSEHAVVPGAAKKLPAEYALLGQAWANGGMAMQWTNAKPGQLAIGVSQLKALVSAAFDAVTSSEGWQERTDDLLKSVDHHYRTELLTSTICLVERAVRSKSITTAAKEYRAAAVLEERMLPVGFSRDFIEQLALCLEQCFANRREQKKRQKKTSSKREGGRPPPPPPPDALLASQLAPPPAAAADPAAMDRLRKIGGIAMPGFAPTATKGRLDESTEVVAQAQAQVPDGRGVAEQAADEWGRVGETDSRALREQAERERVAHDAVVRAGAPTRKTRRSYRLWTSDRS